MKNTKKGFTLVELLVVIAILAILATVAVVGYTSFTKKANISNDTVIAKELTTLIQATDINDSVEDFNDVIDVLHANGFVLANLNTKTEGCFFVWDSKENQILLVDANDGFKVIFPEGEYTPNSNWHLAVCDAATCEKFLVNDTIKNANVQIVPVVTEIKDLASILGSAGIEEVYIDESLTVLDDSSAVVNLNLGATKVSSPILSSVPFVVNNGTLSIVGGEITAAGELLDADGDIQHIAITGNDGTLNITDTKIIGQKNMPINYAGADGTMKNVTSTGASWGAMGAFDGSQVTLDGCTFDAEEATIWLSSNGTESSEVTRITVNGGTYTAKANTVAVYQYPHSGAQGAAEVVINGGEFSSEDGKVFYCMSSVTGGSKIYVYGGTFQDKSFVADDETFKSHLQDLTKDGTVTWNAELQCYIIQK